MKNFCKSLLFIFLIISSSNNGFAQTSANAGLQKVVIIRHGEKPDNGDNLSCKGFNRSLQLPSVLYSKFKIPNKIFVPSVNNGKSTNQSRMFETIAPFAIKYNLKIDSKYKVDDVKDVAAAIMKANGYVLVVWEHDKINNIVKALGIDDKGMKWSGDDFDSIWIINFKNGKGTLSLDKENINPADNCN